VLTSTKWLGDYLDLSMSQDELIDRLTMSGLNHDGTDQVGDDVVLDLEVTSNRPDCLGHVGIAREVATLFQLPLNLPDPRPVATGKSIDQECQVQIECQQHCYRHCYRYTARLIKGVKVGPSPRWLQDRLTAINVGVVNNIVDITNFVMFECGQPLHAFDFQKIAGKQIVVRLAKPGETITAIDHREYPLAADMCVIADGERPVAVGGVMGGFDSEVSEATVDVLIEAAYFDQLSVRNTARALNLHSPSSFRFERDINSANLDWASRRCCQLILEMAGGELADGFIDVGQFPPDPPAITLRWDQIQRVLGIEIPRPFVSATLISLGLTLVSEDQHAIVLTPPHWRKDLSREIDLIEEVGRIYGYDKVPDDQPVPMAASHRPAIDRVSDAVRNMLTAAGFDEAVTASLVPAPWSEVFSPWCDQPALKSSQPMLGVLEKASQNIGAVDRLRRSLIPSLLEVRRINDYRSNEEIELFEIAKVYLAATDGNIPKQPTKIAFTSQRDYLSVKGIVENLAGTIAPRSRLEWQPCQFDLLDVNHSGEFQLGGKTWGWIGEVSKTGKKGFGIKGKVTVGEFDLGRLAELAVLVPQHQNQSVFPPVSRDLNFILDDTIYWKNLETTVRMAGGAVLERVEYRETFRDESRDGAGKKRILMSLLLRSDSGTMTGEQVEEVCQRIVSACQNEHQAVLSG